MISFTAIALDSICETCKSNAASVPIVCAGSRIPLKGKIIDVRLGKALKSPYKARKGLIMRVRAS